MPTKILFITAVILIIIIISGTQGKQEKKLVVVAVTTEITDGYLLYIRSLNVYGFKNQRILATGRNYTGHSIKIKLLREEIKKYKDQDDVIILFTDSYDVVFIAGEKEILEAFESFNASIVFSAESNCWPSPILKNRYPEVKVGYRFLNSGGIIGYASDLYDLLPPNLPNEFDDQLYYTFTYISQTYRTYFNIVLDTQAKLFQCLHDAKDHVSFVYGDDDIKLINHYTNSTPSVIHGNGNGKPLLHTFSSYLAKSWTPSKGCLSCNENKLDLHNATNDEYPLVLMAVFIDRPTPFLELKLQRISSLSYPKKRIFLFVYNKIHLYEETVRRWINDNGPLYKEFNFLLSPVRNMSIGEVRNLAMKTCKYISCDIYFSVDSVANIENPDTLTILVSYKKTALAPVMTKPGTLTSTFWGSVTDDVYFRYIESFDYQNIINNTRRGIWCVPQLWHIYVLQGYMLDNLEYQRALYTLKIDPDISISLVTKLSKKVSMLLYATNLDYYGHLSNMEYVTLDNLHNDLWQVESNSKDWEKIYLHTHFNQQLNEDFSIKMVCPDVFMFPLFSEEFCKQIIETIESVQTELPIKNHRIRTGNTDHSATVTHFNQIGYDKEWNYIIKKFIEPLIEKAYTGVLNKSENKMGFVLRHSMDDSMDISSPADILYTINIALNNQGCSLNFLPYNCSVEDLPVGWAIIYPGKSILHHQYYPITNGTKYNIISYQGT